LSSVNSKTLSLAMRDGPPQIGLFFVALNTTFRQI